MKRILIALLALLMILTAVSCSFITDKKADETRKAEDKTDAATDSEEAETEKASAKDFEFTFKSLKIKVASIEELAYDPDSDSFEAPDGKYVVVTCDILEGEESTGALSGLYDCLKLSGIEADNIGTSGSMRMTGEKIYVTTETVLSFRFDVPADFDIAAAKLTAE